MKKLHKKISDNSQLYFDWHQNPNSDKAHWGILFLVTTVFTLAVFSSFSSYLKFTSNMLANASSARDGFIPPGLVDKDDLENITRAPGLSLNEYNTELLNLVTDLKESPKENKSVTAKRIAEYAKMRKDVVLKKMKEDPESVLRGALPDSVINNLPDEAISSIEKRKKVSGKFEYIHIHYGDFETGTTVEEYYLVDNSTNKRYQVLMKDIPKAVTDDVVTIDGAVLDDYIATGREYIQINSSPNGQISKKEEPGIFARIQKALGLNKAEAQTVNQRKTAVILLNWQNDTRTTFTTDSAKSAVFTGANSTNSYFKENSFNKVELVGRLGLEGDVFGWVTIPYDNVNCSSMYNTWASAADNALKAQGIDMSSYNIKTYVFPSISCGWSGLAYVGGTNTTSFINSTSIGVITHEIGHNLGAHHAGALTCNENGVRVPISVDSNCTISEYGDPYNVMGSASGMKHFSGYHKSITTNALNWLSSSNTQTIDRFASPEGTYSIKPIEKSSSGVQSLRIPRTISSTGVISDYYYLEYRQPIGFDKALGTSVTGGVLIRIAPSNTSSGKTKLIDTTPETTSFADSALLVGKTFTDPMKAISITTLAVSTTSAEVQISFGQQPCTRENPYLALGPASASIYPGQSIQFTYTITNTDSGTCPPSSFTVAPTLPTGFTQSIPASATHSLNPGASVSGTFVINSAADIAPNTYPISVKVNNTSSGRSNSYSFSAKILPPDTIIPVVTIGNPKDGITVSKGKLSISSSASDVGGISQISIIVDGATIKSCFNVTSCGANVNTNSLSSGSHNITVKAWDKSGPVANVGTASVTILKK